LVGAGALQAVVKTNVTANSPITINGARLMRPLSASISFHIIYASTGQEEAFQNFHHLSFVSDSRTKDGCGVLVGAASRFGRSSRSMVKCPISYNFHGRKDPMGTEPAPGGESVARTANSHQVSIARTSLPTQRGTSNA